ncbi:hypothetical protein GCM10010387_29210 [Streptomyces inusitatus]|uniref:Uncharacterized protein n=1 Tax=Streptomyces inusitatus TaxID=68221 RepID=A0A918Q499_9ACTN|nr:hypothetical protein [Streptomyces inusitatus]GGZ33236.1 hypothetical protein GCM10010387_29210 [Streptomyces inusitatus]
MPGNHKPDSEPTGTSGETVPESDGDHQDESARTVVPAESLDVADLTGFLTA